MLGCGEGARGDSQILRNPGVTQPLVQPGLDRMDTTDAYGKHTMMIRNCQLRFGSGCLYLLFHFTEHAKEGNTATNNSALILRRGRPPRAAEVLK